MVQPLGTNRPVKAGVIESQDSTIIITSHTVRTILIKKNSGYGLGTGLCPIIRGGLQIDRSHSFESSIIIFSLTLRDNYSSIR